VTSGPETVFQESTYQPDSTYRWMGSAAMDKLGDIAVGFSASSSSVFPGLRYAARLATDPLNTLAQGEAVLQAGAGSQTGTNSRWGDYSDMTVDPADDCTFWFTSEYYPSGTSSFNWRTRIGNFQLPGCAGPPTTGTIAGQVTDTNTGLGVSGATVTLSGGGTGSTTTDPSGNYSFPNLAPADYTVAATRGGYTAGAGSTATVTVTVGNTSTANLTLTSRPIRTTAFTFPGVAPSAVTTSAGDNNGYQTAPDGWWTAFDSNVAQDPSSGTASSQTCAASTRDQETFTGFSFSSVTGTIEGIQVQLRGRSSSTGSSPKFCVQLWNGTAWSAGKVTASLKTSYQTYTLGSTTNPWGLGWSSSIFTGGTFKVRVTDLANSTGRTFYLDGLSVAVTYQ
jgi:hypothetical protein